MAQTSHAVVVDFLGGVRGAGTPSPSVGRSVWLPDQGRLNVVARQGHSRRSGDRARWQPSTKVGGAPGVEPMAQREASAMEGAGAIDEEPTDSASE
jgi:hypothetical protein